MGRWVDRVKIVKVETLLHCGPYAKSKEWKSTRTMLHGAIGRVSWPPGSGKFTIYPESGKSRGCGNGVKPIKSELMTELAAKGWKLEEPLAIAVLKRPGDLDAVLETKHGPVAVEWEVAVNFDWRETPLNSLEPPLRMVRQPILINCKIYAPTRMKHTAAATTRQLRTSPAVLLRWRQNTGAHGACWESRCSS